MQKAKLADVSHPLKLGNHVSPIAIRPLFPDLVLIPTLQRNIWEDGQILRLRRMGGHRPHSPR